MASPYAGIAEAEWLGVTEALAKEHPLALDQIRESCLEAWGLVWKTTIGEGERSFLLLEADPPAQVIGYFFEKLIAKVLAARFPGVWRGCASKDQKDLVHVPDPSKSIEVKCSGQLGVKIFGNRSTGQRGPKSRAADKPEKSGYYITVNFHGTELVLLRFGWIDEEDWDAQKAPTGQASGLADRVYSGKLLQISGEYRLGAPVGILSGIGKSRASRLSVEGVNTIGDLLSYSGNAPWIKSLKENAAPHYSAHHA